MDGKIVELYQGGLSIRAVARELAIAPHNVRRALKRSGVKARLISEAKRGQKPASHTVAASVAARRKHAIPGRPVVGYKLNAEGYVLLWNRETQSYEREHRKFVEQKIGRPLSPAEIVHHDNRERADNALGNLILKASRSAHQQEHYHQDNRVDPKTGRFI